MDEHINKIVKLPLATKLGVLAALAVALTGLTYWQLVSDTRQQTEAQNRRLDRERETLFQRQAIANRLPEYRREMEEIERTLERALLEMPAETRMDDLISQLAEIAGKAGLELTNISPQGEVREDTFYYRIPVRMQVAGSYHEVAVFLDLVSRLRRIVNVTNIQLGTPRVESERVVLQATYMATTFRFSEQEQESQAGGAGGDRGRRR